MNEISLKAQSLYDNGKEQDAVVLLAKELEKNFRQLPLILQLSTYLSYGGEFEQAEELLIKAKGLFAKELTIDYNLGNIYYTQGEYDKAQAIFDSLVNKKFGHEAMFMLAQTLNKLGQVNQALVYAITASDMVNNDAAYPELVGDLFMSIGDFNHAKDYYQNSYDIKINEKNSFNLGLCKMALKEEYKKYFSESKKINSEFYEKNIQKLDDIQKLINSQN